ncbi:TPA_asm: hypothetical protein GNB92_000945 [Salmonella enterica subsp. enterica serovar Typhimurium]|uniref:Uncharacterized protein n=1 Tax=Salmonella typhimurium TaxID=90371 RepID=A0A736PYX7_SALTM|nr:hypothetical protein [Salmonella enterica subsp. enterica serovar Typhimurium]
MSDLRHFLFSERFTRVNTLLPNIVRNILVICLLPLFCICCVVLQLDNFFFSVRVGVFL